jgi:5-methylcytosine-specific restriction endonuclease McrA
MYVLTNGSYYCNKTDSNRIIKIQNLSNASKYESKEVADKELTRASHKLKGFHVLEIEEQETVSKKVCKRISFDTDVRKLIYRNSKGHCCLCGKFVDYEDFTVDHIIPLAKGGTNEIDNLQCACKVCNNIKTDVLPNEFIDKITEMIVYSMNKKYNRCIGRKMIHMLITSNIHRITKHNN